MIEGAEEFVRHIFPIIVYQIPIKNNQELKESYLAKIQQTYDLCPTDPPKDWLTTKMHTSFHAPDLNRIVFGDEFPSRMYLNHIDKVFDGRWVGKIHQYWFNCYVNGEFQEKHHVVQREIIIHSSLAFTFYSLIRSVTYHQRSVIHCHN